MKHILIIALLACSWVLNAQGSAPASTGVQRFRHGEIVDAGISLKTVNINNHEKMLPITYSNPAYVIIRVKLDPNRSISIHDFSLIHNYQAFKCVALSPAKSQFNAEQRQFIPSKQPKLYDLLFVLEIPGFKSTINYRCTLHYNLGGGGLTDVDVNLKNFDRNSIQLANPAPGN